MIAVCGSNVNLDTLHQIPVERPERAGRVWQGIQHGELVDAVLDETSLRGWRVTDMRFALGNSPSELAAAFELHIPGIEPPPGQSFSLGLLTSNAMKRRLKMVVGSNVFVCNNGVATGEIVMLKRHTTRLDLFGEVERSLDEYAIKAAAIPLMVEGLRQRDLSPLEQEHVLMEAGRLGLMPWSRIGQVDEEYRHPRFAEHGIGTAWSLLQAFTWVVKKDPPLRQMDEMNAFRRLLPSAGQPMVLESTAV